MSASNPAGALSYPHVVVRLADLEGANVYAIIGRVVAALSREVSREAGERFKTAALSSRSYEAVWELARAAVDVR